jgi:positive regulator of sigma E activity
MARPKTSKTKSPKQAKSRATFRTRLKESDGQYLLKLVVVIIIGTFWFKFGHIFYLGNFAVTGVPLGMLTGLLLVDKFEVHQDDRKIWYAILLIVAIISYFLPMGVVL